MRRPVRGPDHARASVGDQIPADRAEAIEALSLIDWWTLPEIDQSPGIRRLTVEAARTVAGHHLLVGLDTWSDDPGAVVVHVIDIWPDRWPDKE